MSLFDLPKHLPGHPYDETLQTPYREISGALTKEFFTKARDNELKQMIDELTSDYYNGLLQKNNAVAYLYESVFTERCLELLMRYSNKKYNNKMLREIFTTMCNAINKLYLRVDIERDIMNYLIHMGYSNQDYIFIIHHIFLIIYYYVDGSDSDSYPRLKEAIHNFGKKFREYLDEVEKKLAKKTVRVLEG